MTTLPALLQRRLLADPGQPFVTYYDDSTGERTELSVKTWANWVSKTANLFADELMLDPGDDLRIDLPPHWLGTVFLGGLLSCGLSLDGTAPVAIVGPDGLGGNLASTTMACALHPFATRFTEPLPPGVLDHGVLWAGQSDVFSPIEPTELGDVVPDDRRVLTDLDPLGEEGRALLVGLLAGTGSLVLVRNLDDSGWPARSQNERATAVLRTDQPIS
ncbi:TIGR03089 family protein [Nocardioides marmorisolisilvae]|uniref:TIGR03089 family protein n=1 Tax=Nocardioides marmorisolisilvae TaxID=1542737 RepID=A0A3N0DSK4_9ACTN|nr:TIGR03089 family protein [Nocardioides marmorisolisilvae]RNL78627.1 TIGR03089 family protein [Nocardioides marmorisolisilvae]